MQRIKPLKLKHFYTYLFMCLCASVLTYLFPKTVQAEFSLGVYPPVLQIHATPPTSIHTQVTVSNSGDVPVNLHLDVKAFRPSTDQNGTITFLKPEEALPGNDQNILQKIEFTNNDGRPFTDFSLSPGGEKTVSIHIALPKDEPSGDYYFSLLFISHEKQKHQNTYADIAGGIATNLLLSIGPYTPITGTIAGFSAPLFALSGPIPFMVSVQNTSTHFTAPRGAIVITNMFGQTVGNLELVPVNVLANSTRFIPGKETNTITEAGSQIPVIFWKEKNLFGLYSARLRMALSDQGPLFERTIHFLALPIEAIAGIVLGSLLVAVVIVRVKKKIRE